MTANPRFPSLFFRQDLNGIGIPFLTVSLVLLLFYHPVTVLLSILVAASFLIFSFRKRNEDLGCTFLLVALGIALALFSLGIHAYEKEKSARFDGQSLEVEGYIIETGEGFAVLSVYAVEGIFHRENIYFDGETVFSTGAKVRGKIEFSPLADPSQGEGIDHVGKGISNLEEVGKSFFISFLSSLRNSFSRHLGSDRVGGFQRAILLGDKSALSSADESAFRQADSSHLLAISGLHVTQIFGLFYFILRYLPLGKRVRYFLVLPIILFVFFFTGGSVSAFRAAAMASFPLVGKILSRRSDSVTALVFAACLVVLWEPSSILTPSFLLSFTSAFSIVYASGHLMDALQRNLFSVSEGKYRFLKRILFYVLSMQIISTVLFVFDFPVQLLLFGEVRPLAPLFAAVLIPLFSPCLILGILSGIPMPFSFLSAGVRFFSDTYVGFYLNSVRIFSSVSYEPISLGKASVPIALAALSFLIGGMIVKARLRNLFYMYGILVLFSFAVPLFVL